MAGVAQYIKESYTELTEKVTWPTWRELQNSAILVIVASLIIAAVIFAMDQVLNFLSQSFYNTLK